jgi:hypothetical protein
MPHGVVRPACPSGAAVRVLLLALLPAFCAAEWRTDFPVDVNNLGTDGHNPYFPLQPGHTLQFVNGKVRNTVTVLAETKTIDGVECRVVVDREEKNGQPVEITRDYYTIDRSTGDVYYFGEEVDIYKRGKVVSHKGSWMSGVDDAKFGLMMPGKITVGDRFMQERAPKQRALDRSEVIAEGEKVVTPAGTLEALHLRDSSAIERGADDKWYAREVGLVKDGKAVLVRAGDARPAAH